MFGRVRGFRYGLIRGVKEGEGVARRYSERRARVSRMHQLMLHVTNHSSICLLTLMVGVEDVLVGVAERKLVGNGRLPAPVRWSPAA
jgi:hypothetical protein